MAYKPALLREILPAIDAQIENEKDQEIATRAFPTWKVSNGELYTIIATTNQGKTF